MAEAMGMSPTASFQQARNGQPKPAHWLTLQRTVGNRATQNLIQRNKLFDKLGSDSSSGQKGNTSQPTLQYGSQGSVVSTLQNLLNLAGTIPQLIADGIFGPKTQGAVQMFQSQNNLVPDGVVGDKTWGKLDAFTAGSNFGEHETHDQDAGTEQNQQNGDFLSNLGKSISGFGSSVSNAVQGPLSWGDLYHRDAQGRIGQIFFQSAESDANDADDVVALNTLAQQLTPHLNAAESPIDIYFLGFADHRPYSGTNEKLAHDRAVRVAGDLNSSLTASWSGIIVNDLGHSVINPDHLAKNYRPIVAGQGVDPNSHGQVATEKQLAQCRRVDIITLHKLVKPKPGEPVVPDDPKTVPGQVVVDKDMPYSSQFIVELISNVNAGTPGIGPGLNLVEFNIYDVENQLQQRFVYQAISIDVSTTFLSGDIDEKRKFVKLEKPVRLKDFAGPAHHTSLAAGGLGISGGMNSFDFLGPKFAGSNVVTITFTKTDYGLSSLVLGGGAGEGFGGLSPAELAKRY
jgi:peptidoglycan hydrolase-like protein with peptidoglycan-binding domain